jgi:hypothetical protein
VKMLPMPFLVLGAILLCGIELTVAQPSPAAVRRGVIFVRVHCSQCHAIGKVGASPLTNAAHSANCVSDILLPTCSGRCLRGSIPQCRDFSSLLVRCGM